MDHVFPVLALACDFSLNMVPFIKRHFIIIVVFCSSYVIVLMYYTVVGTAPYPGIDWTSFRGTLLPFLVMVIGIVVFYSLEYLTRKKLAYVGGDHNKSILEILSK